MHPDAQALIDSLALRPHPEGGWYRETFRSAERVTSASGAPRSALTSILFLLAHGTFSAFHRLTSDEAWHFYRGDALTLELIDPAGRYEQRALGEENRQTVIPAGTYFAAHVDAPDGFALVGCDVAPGFEFADFQLPVRSVLTAAYPQFGPLIARFTRSGGT